MTSASGKGSAEIVREVANMRRRRSYPEPGGRVTAWFGPAAALRAFRRSGTARGRSARVRRRRFEDVLSLSLVVAEELVLVDARTLAPTSVLLFDRLVDDGRLRRARDPAQVRVRTRSALTVADAARELASARATIAARLGGVASSVAVGITVSPLVEPGRGDGGVLGAVGAFPLRPLPSGLHVQVAVEGADRALHVCNAARSYLPEIAALAANSPFCAGVDTGLASSRLKLLEDRPYAGIPPAFSSWEVFEDFLASASGAPDVDAPASLSWDLRLDPRHGTLDFRVPDVQTTVADAAAVAAVCQALVAFLLRRQDEGKELPLHQSHEIAANRWRALRGGVEGELIDLERESLVATRERLARLLTLLEADADRLGYANGASRQRAVHAERGVGGLQEWLVEQTALGVRE
jgi:carboxylate-amine ligase